MKTLDIERQLLKLSLGTVGRPSTLNVLSIRNPQSKIFRIADDGIRTLTLTKPLLYQPKFSPTRQIWQGFAIDPETKAT